jgi:processive 1,2-diacylglycerol beta-glucosyltransferase
VPGVELTVVCGAAKGMARRIRRDAETWGVHARVLGFERDMAGRVAEAHVVVGKAGGLTVSETLTAGRPMILVGTVPGNELSNQDLVVRGGAGLAAGPRDVGPLAQWMRAQGEITPMGARARRLLLAHSADHVIEVVSRLASNRGRRSAA